MQVEHSLQRLRLQRSWYLGPELLPKRSRQPPAPVLPLCRGWRETIPCRLVPAAAGARAGAVVAAAVQPQPSPPPAPAVRAGLAPAAGEEGEAGCAAAARAGPGAAAGGWAEPGIVAALWADARPGGWWRWVGRRIWNYHGEECGRAPFDPLQRAQPSCRGHWQASGGRDGDLQQGRCLRQPDERGEAAPPATLAQPVSAACQQQNSVSFRALRSRLLGVQEWCTCTA